MEQIGHGKAEQELHLEGQKLPSGVEKPSAMSPIPLQKLGAVGNQHLQTSFASLTPVKTNESSQIKPKQEATELPEKYRILSEFFDRLICSIRLLTLRKRLPIFRNISVQVERLTGRTFQYRHLAQMKHILPEAMKIEKILVHDKESLCMKPDLNITLVSDIIEHDSEPSTFVALSNLFASRLRRFFSSHPEVCDIPEAELPDTFNQSGTTIETASSCTGRLMPIETDVSNPSHLCASFNRRFSRDEVDGEIKKTKLFTSPFPDLPTKVDHLSDEEMETSRESLDACSKSNVINTAQMECLPSPSLVSANACESTPLKLLPLESDKITLETPIQFTPKRSISACENKQKTVINENNIVSSLTAKRSLYFTHSEGDGFPGVETEGDTLKDRITASPKPFLKVDENDSFTDDNHMMIYPHSLTEHHQTSTCLSDLVPVIHQIFESASCHSITKEELVHKIIMNSLDIDENSDIEGQIELLEKLVPDWICKKSTPGGQLYSVKKVSDLNTVRERLISI